MLKSRFLSSHSKHTLSRSSPNGVCQRDNRTHNTGRSLIDLEHAVAASTLKPVPCLDVIQATPSRPEVADPSLVRKVSFFDIGTPRKRLRTKTPDCSLSGAIVSHRAQSVPEDVPQVDAHAADKQDVVGKGDAKHTLFDPKKRKHVFQPYDRKGALKAKSYKHLPGGSTLHELGSLESNKGGITGEEDCHIPSLPVDIAPSPETLDDGTLRNSVNKSVHPEARGSDDPNGSFQSEGTRGIKRKEGPQGRAGPSRRGFKVTKSTSDMIIAPRYVSILAESGDQQHAQRETCSLDISRDLDT